MHFFRYAFFVFLLIPFVIFTAAVVSVSPASHIITADGNSVLVVDFDEAIDPASVTPASFAVFGRWSGVMSGNFSFHNNNQQVQFTPAKPFSAGEFVTVTLAKTITNTGGTALDNGYSWGFWIRAAPNGIALQETARIEVRQPGEGHIQTYGAYAGDLNGDGYTDYSVPNERSNDVRVFLNDGSGGYNNFTIHPMPNGASIPSTNEGADFNMDGHIDFVVGSIGNNRATVFMGDGAGGFLSITNYSTSGSNVRGITVLDVDGDCDPDIVSCNYNSNNLSLLINDGSGNFSTPMPLESGGNGERAIMAMDANNDGLTDLFVGAFNSSEMLLLLGDGDGGFQLSDRFDMDGTPWMIATGDVDGNGSPDVVSANSNNDSAAVIFTDGQGNFTHADFYYSGANFPLAIDLGDLDGDGDLDMMVSNYGNFSSPVNGKWRLYENDGTGKFINPQDYLAAKAASCAIFHDRDSDGDLDVTCIDELDDLLFIFEAAPSLIYEDGKPITDFRLFQNYPNPFNPETKIEYYLPKNSFVSLAIYDTHGRLIRTLVNENQPRGSASATWDGLDKQGFAVASGIYLYKISTTEFTDARKMILLK